MLSWSNFLTIYGVALTIAIAIAQCGTSETKKTIAGEENIVEKSEYGLINVDNSVDKWNVTAG